ncbi:MAG TPA: penicillin-binding protein 2 [Luteimonas sp.]|nr:penicillin-binding protein 2 [Luteimonas sp.]
MRRRLKNQAAETAQFRMRALLGFAIVVLALAGLGGWYFKLQVLDHADYARRSEANRIKPRPVVPARGIIYDRKGRILADNVPAFRLDVVPEDAGDLKALVAALSRIVALAPEDIERFERERKSSRGFRAITLKLRLTDDEVARFAVDQWRFPGVSVEPYLTRRYPYGALFAHIVGYVGRTDEKDIKEYGEGHAVFTHTGRAGIERYYDEALRGKVGYEEVKTNVEGRALGRVGRIPATAGADLRLGVDLDLQRTMVEAFGDNDGSAVAIDPKTGEILAMVSLPSYDPNLFVNGISNADYRALMDNPSRPLFNRNVLGGGPPGSTVKPFMALAGLESGLRRPEDKVFSTGEFHIPGQRRGYRDAHGGSGWVDLHKSIAASVNYYYYKLAYDMGIARLDEYMRRYGFGEPTGIDLLGENAGVVPSPEWKAKNRKEPWYPGETVIAGIGQGYWVATTLQLAQGVAALAADGVRHRPHLARDRRDGFRGAWTPMSQPPGRRLTDNLDHIRAVQGGMVGTMYDPGGTGRATAIGAPYRMAGKTGTAQKVSRKGNVSTNPHSLPLHLRHQAWFIGYAPVEDPRIAVAVMVEHGGYGGSTAAPIARKLFDAWLLGKYPEPDPDAIPVTAIGAQAVAAQAAPAPQGAARAAHASVDAAAIAAPAGTGAGR